MPVGSTEIYTQSVKKHNMRGCKMVQRNYGSTDIANEFHMISVR